MKDQLIIAKKKFKILGSAHNLKEIKIKELQNIEEIFLSPLFKEKTNKQLNIYKYLKLREITKMRDISLGGINNKNIKITDNNSTNGIYINNVIKSDSELKSGDKIQIGKYLLLLTEVMK